MRILLPVLLLLSGPTQQPVNEAFQGFRTGSRKVLPAGPERAPGKGPRLGQQHEQADEQGQLHPSIYIHHIIYPVLKPVGSLETFPVYDAPATNKVNNQDDDTR